MRVLLTDCPGAALNEEERSQDIILEETKVLWFLGQAHRILGNLDSVPSAPQRAKRKRRGGKPLPRALFLNSQRESFKKD